MPSRKGFVTAAAASVGALGAIPALAQSTMPAQAPTSSPSSSPPPSSSAREFALRMRAYDPQLSDADIETIATGIEGNWKLGNTVNPKGLALTNSDEPVPAFSVE